MDIQVDATRCNGCGRCESACPFGAISVQKACARISIGCTGCGACEDACPRRAIRVEQAPKGALDLLSYRDIWVFVEHDRGRLRPASCELLCVAGRLAKKMDQRLVAVVAGQKVECLSRSCSRFGADVVYVLEHELLVHYDTQLYASVLCGLIETGKPAILLLAATHLGRDLAPRVASRLRTGLTADCTELDVDPDGNLIQVRPTYGGGLLASIVCPAHRPQMATVRPGVMRADPNVKGPPEIHGIEVTLSRSSPAVRVVSELQRSGETEDLETAEVVVAGGRGVGSAHGFEKIEELAHAVGGVVGASRGAVDEGWNPQQKQVGQSGRAVAPRLYIACGISGASQHLIGMRNSRKIVAINKDRNAPIMRIADVAVVGDLHVIVPSLVARLKKKNM